ncbi:MAG TPA: bacteriohemerythrin [Anaeromyxobacteraceae bacterium]|nr:bacteriohemerythrin [Anaeromyxobacteraceae bacterium]
MTEKALGEGLETGIAEIDDEHRLQIELVQLLQEALGTSDAAGRAVEVLSRLLDYTHVHFEAEGLMMRLHAYPGYQAHLQEHEKLLGQLEELQRYFAAGEFAPSRELVDAVRHWLVDHIRTVDRAFATFLETSRKTATP